MEPSEELAPFNAVPFSESAAASAFSNVVASCLEVARMEIHFKDHSNSSIARVRHHQDLMVAEVDGKLLGEKN